MLLRTVDGLSLHAWFMWPAHWAEKPGLAAAQLKARPVVLFFQENAGAAGGSRRRIGGLQPRTKFSPETSATVVLHVECTGAAHKVPPLVGLG